MDSKAQAEGEKRVRELLFQPLLDLGLGKPPTVSTKAQFDKMIEEVSARLAYMNDDALLGLREEIEANPGGKTGDRIPNGALILKMAAVHQPPSESASPLMRSVFAAEVGKAAVREGWAPELLENLRRNRKWPTPFVVRQIKEMADDKVRRLIKIEEAMANGYEPSEVDRKYRDQRLAVIRRCEDLGKMDAGAAA